jgi:GWxTD domain-containing protein
MKSTFILLCFLLFLSSVSGIDLSKLNTAYWYDPSAPLTIRSRVAQRSDTLHVFLSLTYNPSDTINTRLLLQTNYFDDTDRLLQAYEMDTLEGTADQILLKLTFKEVSEQLLVLEFELAGAYYYYPINLKRGRLNHPQFYPLQMNGIPLISSFLTSSSLKFNRDYAQDTLYFFQYKADFQPADPPTGIAHSVASRLLMDSVFISTQEVSLLQNHFYFIQSDTLSLEGLTLFMGPKHYPYMKLMDELIPPLTYFTSRSELDEIRNAKDPKIAFENFWLNIHISPEAAGAAIRSYYRAIKKANELFTSYKEGWKTDRGMVYVIFGNPDRVFRDNKKEIWLYGDIRFEFKIISNLFAPKMYVLLRDKGYEKIWIKKITDLRSAL